MLVISGVLRFPAELREEIVPRLIEVAERSRKDTGCVDYSWSEALDEPGAFHFFECWESEETFQAHISAPYELEFNESVVARITGASAHRYEVTERRSITG
jgi:quinol monooxygenase YgiN